MYHESDLMLHVTFLKWPTMANWQMTNNILLLLLLLFFFVWQKPWQIRTTAGTYTGVDSTNIKTHCTEVEYLLKIANWHFLLFLPKIKNRFNFRFTSGSQRGKLQSCEKLQISQNDFESLKSLKVLHFKAVKLDLEEEEWKLNCKSRSRESCSTRGKNF